MFPKYFPEHKRFSCLTGSVIEAYLFSGDASPPEDDCPICLESLKEKAEGTCCDGYARKLIKCNHWFHVHCYLELNQTLSICPICRTKQLEN